MRRCLFWLTLNLLSLVTLVGAQTNAVKLCVAQDNNDGYDALRLAQQLWSRKLADGTTLAVTALTVGMPSPEWERRLTDANSPVHWVNVAGKTAKERDQEIARLECDYSVKVWYHESVDDLESNCAAFVPCPMPGPRPEPTGDQSAVGYELRRFGKGKVLSKGTLPPRTVYGRQGHRMFDPYLVMADKIINKLQSAVGK